MTDNWLEDADRERRDRASGRVASALTLMQARGLSPEAVAQAERSARILGLPPLAVVNTPSLNRDAQAQRDIAVLQTAPATDRFLADPANAAVAHDQVERLAQLERALRPPQDGQWYMAPTTAPGTARFYSRDEQQRRLLAARSEAARGRGQSAARTAVGRFIERQGPVGRGFANLTRGIAERTGQLGGGLLRTGFTIVDTPADWLSRGTEALGVPSMVEFKDGRLVFSHATEDDYRSAVGGAGNENLVRGLENTNAGYAPGTTWEEVKQRPAAALIPFALEQGVISAPDMAAVLISLPAYVAARTGQMGQTRAENDLREDATVGDLLAAMPAAAASALLERIGTKGILGIGEKVAVRGLTAIPRAVGAAALKEGLTEAGQEGIESVGETLGTERGFSATDTLERMLAGGLAGAIFGGSIRTVTAPLQQHMDRQRAALDAKAGIQEIDAAAEAIRDNPLLERAPERLRAFIEGLAGDDDVAIPSERVRSFFQSNPDLDPWLDEWNIRDQYEESLVSGADITMSKGEYLARVAPTEAHGFFRDDLRLGADALTLREAEALEAEGVERLQAVVREVTQAVEEQVAEATPGQAVFDDVFRQLKAAGFADAVARQYAAVWRARSETRAARLPNLYPDALAAYRAQPLTITQAIPDALRNNRDRLDVMIEALRKGGARATDRQLFGASLLEFISSAGGMTDPGGELLAMGADGWHRGRRVGTRRLIRPPAEGSTDNRYQADYVLQRAIEAGYLPEGATQRDLFDAMEGELRGRAMYAQTGDMDFRSAENRQALDDLEEVLGQLGIDPREASNAEIKSALDRLAAEPEGEVRAGFDQSERGRIDFTSTGRTIRLFKGRDLSTFLHESGHAFLEELMADAALDDAGQVAADRDAVLQWFGVASADEIGVEQHEQWARAAEAYFMEGKAPSLELRSAFSRFKAWLVAIYRTVARLRTPINDDIRGVMDRLLATDTQIAEAEAKAVHNRLFADAEAAGMTEAEFARYSALDAKARAAATDRMMKKVMEPLRRRRTQEYDEAWHKARPANEEHVDALPEMRALAWLKENKAQFSRQALVDMYGSDAILGLLPYARPALYSAEGGVHPDALAEIVGATSGEELLNLLMQVEAERVELRDGGDRRSVRDARVDLLTDEDMVEMWGDPFTDGRLEQEALDAVHEMQRAETMNSEANALARRAGVDGLWTVEAMQDFARRSVERLPARKVRPEAYLRAERAAGNEAQRAFAAQRFDDALDAKLRQNVNFHLYRAAVDAEAAITKANELFGRVMAGREADVSRYRNMDMVYAARGVLAAYNVARWDQDAAAYLSKLREYDPDTWAILEPYVTAATANAKPVVDLTYQEFSEMAAVVKQLWEMSRRSKVVEIDGRRMELEKVTGELTVTLLDRGPPKHADPGRHGAVTDKEKFLNGLLGMGALVTKVEEWAARKGPEFTRYIWTPVSKAADEYRAARREYIPRLLEALKAIRPDMAKSYQIDAPELGYVFGKNRGAGLAELLGALRHTGNDSNLRKLLLGRGWASERPDGSLDTTRWDSFIARKHADGTIQKRHWDYLQAEWDLHEAIKPLAQRAHRAMYGRYFSEITAAPVTTPFGVYKGGYVAARVDPNIDAAAQARAAEGMLDGARSGTFMFPGPANGFTKSRVEYNSALDLDIRQAVTQLDEVLRFSFLGPAVRDVNRIVADRGFAAVLRQYDPNAFLGVLLPWMERTVTQRTNTASRSAGGRFFDAVVAQIGRNTGMSIMFGSLLNTAQQVTGFGPAMLRTGKGNMVNALRVYLLDPAGTTRMVRQASKLMAERADTQMQEVADAANDIVLNPNLYEKAVRWTERHAYFMQHGFQNVMDPIIWLAARSKAIQMKEADPEAYADGVIRTTQGSRNPEDITSFSTGPKWAAPFKAFTGYFIDQANLLDTEWRKAGSWGRRAEVYALGFLIPAAVAKLIAEALSGRLDPDDEDGLLDDAFDILVMSQIQYALAMVPLFGQAANLTINRFDGKMYNDRLSVAPFVSTLEAATRVPFDLYKITQGDGDASDTVKDVLTAVAVATGLPMPTRQAGYVADVAEGDVEPTGPVDAARGLATGSASPGSRL